MKTKFFTSVLLLAFLVFNFSTFADAIKDIEKAKKEGKSFYLIVMDKNAKGTDALVKMAEDAKKKTKNTTVIKFDRDDKANADLVSKYRLAGAPLPLVLIVASNGVVSGSLTSADATTEKLTSFLPTKTQAEILLGFENGNAALIVCGKKNAKDKEALIAECKTAIKGLGNKATQVFVDVDSKDEANFLALIKPDLTKTTVLIFNGKGQYTGTHEATAKSADLVALVNKKMGGGCGSKCGTGSGCGKK